MTLAKRHTCNVIVQQHVARNMPILLVITINMVWLRQAETQHVNFFKNKLELIGVDLTNLFVRIRGHDGTYSPGSVGISLKMTQQE